MVPLSCPRTSVSIEELISMVKGRRCSDRRDQVTPENQIMWIVGGQWHVQRKKIKVPLTEESLRELGGPN